MNEYNILQYIISKIILENLFSCLTKKKIYLVVFNKIFYTFKFFMSNLDIEIWKIICLLLVFVESQSSYLVGYNLIDNMVKDNNH